MQIIKGYMLWRTAATLAILVLELSALDVSEKWLWTCNSYTVWNKSSEALSVIMFLINRIITVDNCYL